MSEALIAALQNEFKPFREVFPGQSFYVDCKDVRGNDDILRGLGRPILRSDEYKSCQLYSGHRGGGKSTELLRLKGHLEEKGYFVIRFQADEDYDAEYTDILLTCTHNIVKKLQRVADPSPLTRWLASRWQALKDLALTEVSIEELSVEAQMGLFGKLTTTLKTNPSTREIIRKQVDRYSVSLTEALNEFIDEAKQQVGTSKLVVIADNLDRIVPISKENGRTNHDDIFIDHSELMKKLGCHVIYTVPISLLYSSRSQQLRSAYGDPEILPMIMVRNPENGYLPFAPGIEKVKEVIRKRINSHAPELALDGDIFDSNETLEQLCLMSGGHIREVMHFMQAALNEIDEFPITQEVTQVAFFKGTESYRETLHQSDWKKLAELHISKSKRIDTDDEYRKLLFDRCVLEYRYKDSTGKPRKWNGVHPLLQETDEFKASVEGLINAT
jgi:hypothetical protein